MAQEDFGKAIQEIMAQGAGRGQEADGGGEATKYDKTMATTAETYHIPVLLKESVDGLGIRPGGVYVDVTFGGGGHSCEILSRLDAEAHLYSFDQDADAEANIVDDERFTFVRSNFRYLKNWMRYYGVEGIDGLLADLGVSSHHFDDATRGFSFRFDAPLDMRMNKRDGMTAADVLNKYDEARLADVFYLYGELKNSRRLAAAVAKARAAKPIATTQDLMDATADLFKREREKKGHGKDVPGAAHRGQQRDERTERDAGGSHGTAEAGRTAVGDNIPQPRRPHSEELHTHGQRRRRSQAGLLRTYRSTVGGSEQTK